jgi:hypothetical protein
MKKPFRRSPPTKKVGKKILIACEGRLTEPKYFNAIRQDLRLTTGQILVLPHQGTDPLSVVSAAVEARQEKKREKNWINEQDTAWAVFDGDEHIENNPSNWHDAIQKAQSQNIKLAITNPCIEFWYLIHFQDHFANISRTAINTLLKNHIPSYDKSACYYPNPLRPYTTQAIQRAEQLACQLQRNNLSGYANPCCSEISSLVKELLSWG